MQINLLRRNKPISVRSFHNEERIANELHQHSSYSGMRLETDLKKTSSEFPHSRVQGHDMRPQSFGTVRASQYGITPRLGSTYVPLQCSSPQNVVSFFAL